MSNPTNIIKEAKRVLGEMQGLDTGNKLLRMAVYNYLDGAMAEAAIVVGENKYLQYSITTIRDILAYNEYSVIDFDIILRFCLRVENCDILTKERFSEFFQIIVDSGLTTLPITKKAEQALLQDLIPENVRLQAEHDSWRRTAEKLARQLHPCLHCHHTGWIHTDDDIPDQMCPHCFVGKAVIKCYDKTVKVQIDNHDQLQAKLDKLQWIPVGKGPPDHCREILILDNRSPKIGRFLNDLYSYWHGSGCNCDEPNSQANITHYKEIVLPDEETSDAQS